MRVLLYLLPQRSLLPFLAMVLLLLLPLLDLRVGLLLSLLLALLGLLLLLLLSVLLMLPLAKLLLVVLELLLPLQFFLQMALLLPLRFVALIPHFIEGEHRIHAFSERIRIPRYKTTQRHITGAATIHQRNSLNKSTAVQYDFPPRYCISVTPGKSKQNKTKQNFQTTKQATHRFDFVF